MWISIIKFLHILMALGLLGLVIYCFSLISSKKTTQYPSLLSINKIILLLILFATITGTFLIYPKHFTFHTPWIQAAYLLVIVFSLMMGAMLFFQKKIKQRWFWQSVYFSLIIILIFVIHDAVTKTTFLFF